jgi:predicted aconitase
MNLTDPQKAILDGSQGAAAQHALALIVRYAGVLEAEQRCRVTWADLFCGTHHYLDVARRAARNLAMLSRFVDSGVILSGTCVP